MFGHGPQLAPCVSPPLPTARYGEGVFDLFSAVATQTFDRPDGTELSLLVAVPDGERRGTVLCLHGFTGAKEDFIFLLPELAMRGFAAYALDARGVHASTSEGPFDLRTLARDVDAVARHVSGPVHLVAHSFGGLVAQRAVIRKPRRFASLTLVCSGPAGFRASADLIPITIERVSAFQNLLSEHDLEQAWDLKTAFENVEMHEAMAAFLRSRFVSGSHAAAVQNIQDALDADDAIDALIETAVPVRVIYGADDGTWAQVTQNDMAARLGTTPIVITESTHLPFLENVDEFVEAYVAALPQLDQELAGQ